tara:strand:- start:25971 stop:26144 length:174 start_codon:yes stop_codon:yes gene_type:complete
MVIELKKGSDKQAIERLLAKLRKQKLKKGLDALKYAGTLSITEDGLKLQKRLRDEWE